MDRQYCRYCAHCVATLDDIAWCEKLQKEMSENSAKRANRCKEILYEDENTVEPEFPITSRGGR